MVNYRRGLLCVLVVVAALEGCVSLSWAETQRSRLFPRIEFGETTPDPRPIRFIQRAPFPTVPQAIPVLKVQELPLAERKKLLVQLFRVLPMDGYYTPPQVKTKLDRLERAHWWSSLPKGEPLETQIGEWVVSVWPSGQFSISSNPPPDGPKRKDLPAPTMAEARQVAESFLPRIKSLLPEPVSFSGVGPAESRSVGSTGWEVLSYRVSYQAEKNGIPVGGVAVVVGSGPRLVAARSLLRRTVADGMAPILSPQEALRRVEKGEGDAQARLGGATAYVDSIKLVYRVQAVAHDMSYIMPLYTFRGEAVVEGKKPATWGGSIEAVRPEFLEPKRSHGE